MFPKLLLHPFLSRTVVYSTLIAAAAAINEQTLPVTNTNTNTNTIPTTVNVDVAIIGGGASGTYAGVRLREDLHKSILIIESSPRLGGHTDTYTVPTTNTTIEYGVQSYINYGAAPSFFSRFNLSTAVPARRALTTLNVDITTGALLTTYTPPSSAATTAAFRTWLEFVEEHESLLEPGYWNFPAPTAIPAEFLTPFGDFARTHGVEAAVPRIAAISDVGVGGLAQILTLDVIQAFGAPITRGVLDGTLVAPQGSNSLLYQRAHALLKNDIYLNASVKRAERNSTGARLVVSTPQGDAVIHAKQVLWTPYPHHAKNLRTFAEDARETEVFASWAPSWSFVAVVHIPCIPENFSVQYLPPTAAPANYLAVRDYPYTLRLDSTGPGGMQLFRMLFSTNYSITHDEVKATVAQNVQNLVDARTLNYTANCEIDFRAFADHTGVTWPRGRTELENGFVQKLYGLQGWRSTWWTGRSWTGYYSSAVWTFTDTVLERMIGALGD
ncbi:FAD/NAD(P)-binding domain-containing protein [Byssothecium circinans]|uniref:FAD/NAD(P)-binding domain-containing protein n=1 Tax=Byssothecium circinans TaxID=147558 RepID=A0A6A5T897_9PLEO|nr:FAD/NAD(P)-binding domain-containing protein [Byssothecium circinans]